MLTPATIIHAPGLIDPNRAPWTGTIAEHFTQTGDRAWDKLAAILADHAIHDEDDMGIAQALEALATAGLDDQELASRLTDDPDTLIEDPEEVIDALTDALNKAFRFHAGYSQRADAHVIHGTGFGLYWTLDGEYGTYGAQWALWGTDETGEDILDDNGLVSYIPGPGAAERTASELLQIVEDTQQRFIREQGNRLAAKTLSTIRKSLDGADWLLHYGGPEGITCKGINIRIGLTDDDDAPRIAQTWELADVEDEEGYGLPDDIADTLDGLNAEDEIDEEDIEGQFERIAAETIKTLRGLTD